MNNNFQNALIRPGIESKSIVSVADALSMRPLFGCKIRWIQTLVRFGQASNQPNNLILAQINKKNHEIQKLKRKCIK